MSRPAFFHEQGNTRVSTIPVKYIGPDPYWHGLLYDTRLRFEQGQTLHLPAGLAMRFLTHQDTFARGEGSAEQPTPQEAANAALKDAETKKAEEQEKSAEVYDVFDQIDRMDKASLAEFAIKYGQQVDKRKSLDALRADAKSFVDRFGAL